MRHRGSVAVAEPVFGVYFCPDPLCLPRFPLFPARVFAASPGIAPRLSMNNLQQHLTIKGADFSPRSLFKHLLLLLLLLLLLAAFSSPAPIGVSPRPRALLPLPPGKNPPFYYFIYLFCLPCRWLRLPGEKPGIFIYLFIYSFIISPPPVAG